MISKALFVAHYFTVTATVMIAILEMSMHRYSKCLTEILHQQEVFKPPNPKTLGTCMLEETMKGLIAIMIVRIWQYANGNQENIQDCNNKLNLGVQITN